MLKISFYQKQDQGSIHMTIRGHAQTAPDGEDLVCSAATMLAYTAAQAVQFFAEQGKLQCKPKIRICKGRATVIATPKEEAFAEVLLTFWVAQCGAQVLAHNYPKHVQLEHLKV